MDETNFIKRLSSSFKAQGPTDDFFIEKSGTSPNLEMFRFAVFIKKEKLVKFVYFIKQVFLIFYLCFVANDNNGTIINDCLEAFV